MDDVASLIGGFKVALSWYNLALMMVGMASVAAAIIGSPLTMVFLVLEGTGNFPVTVGVMVGVVIASTIVRLTFGYSFSTWRFHQRGIGVRSPHDIGWLADLTVGRLRTPGGFWLVADGAMLNVHYTDWLGQSV